MDRWMDGWTDGWSRVCLGHAQTFVFSPGLDKSLGASCKDSIGWMFSKLDTSADLFLDQMELAAINLDKYEVCIRPFFNSCDTYKDGRVSTAEWCFCFWRESECGPLARIPSPCAGSAPHSRLSLGIGVAPSWPLPQAQNFSSASASCTLPGPHLLERREASSLTPFLGRLGGGSRFCRSLKPMYLWRPS